MRVLVSTCLLCICVLFVSCDTYSNESRDDGTNIGFINCLENNKGKGLSKDLIRTQCLNKHQNKIDFKFNGSAYYDEVGDPDNDPKDLKGIFNIISWSSENYVYLTGMISNDTEDMIVTSYTIVIVNKDHIEGQLSPRKEFYKIENVYIEPGKKDNFEVKNIEFVPKKGKRALFADDADYDYYFTDVNGLKISVQ